MSEIKKKMSERGELSQVVAEKPSQTLGRKRDHTRDDKILEATIDILADTSFDGMTMDMVAARAKAGKATVYRRWSSKAELVRDALAWMNRNHLELESLPDIGTLREDLLVLLKPQSIAEEERKFRVLAGLGSFLQHPEFAEAGTAGIFEPWVVVNRELMNRAVVRGEIPAHADIEMACQVITSMASFRGLIQRKPFDKPFFTALIDGILLPALKNPQTAPNIMDR
ncbi:TetR/AcrR family transcriptional regulator [Paenibacillus polymyxa]|uniref:TetR/AcrR family transcriptional regulator n=1 Tax=Paenibacillus polymyxa TaxID=1406 RepID=UPI000471B93A|nr:TetR/AcrR family transcriptional regulator [Paenibacillus polymyxa]